MNKYVKISNIGDHIEVTVNFNVYGDEIELYLWNGIQILVTCIVGGIIIMEVMDGNVDVIRVDQNYMVVCTKRVEQRNVLASPIITTGKILFVHYFMFNIPN